MLWSATVAPPGFLTRPAVLMSKHWMDKVWSWDHCFNALALAAGVPELAWDQFQLPFDHQDAAGALPDSVTHSEVLLQLRQAAHPRLGPAPACADASRAADRRAAQTYRRLARWTDVLARRTAAPPASDLPHYQHGNDSGWDNATTFDHERVVETADLAAFLVLQLRELADLAAELGDADAARWTARGRPDARRPARASCGTANGSSPAAR